MTQNNVDNKSGTEQEAVTEWGNAKVRVQPHHTQYKTGGRTVNIYSAACPRGISRKRLKHVVGSIYRMECDDEMLYVDIISGNYITRTIFDIGTMQFSPSPEQCLSEYEEISSDAFALAIQECVYGQAVFLFAGFDTTDHITVFFLDEKMERGVGVGLRSGGNTFFCKIAL